ncbi:MAG: CapA family protein [Bacteroidetes bacterium]|nr:CapA family protein [Bacteroidota bacterium]
MKISFIGDVMLGRFIASKYRKTNYQVVDSKVIKYLKKSDYIIGNLESPVSSKIQDGDDHLAFKGEAGLLTQFKLIDCFSLSNNHINDFGKEGMDDTVEELNNNGIKWNGLFKKEYKPFIIDDGHVKCALFTCTDMMNIPFDNENPWTTPKVDDHFLDEKIMEYQEMGYFNILYAHVGMLFTRFPNPPIRELLQKKIEIGVGCIVTVHSHVLGGMENHNGSPIFYSIGDFVMDGNSYRRRGASVLTIEIDQNKVISWDIEPTIINKELITVFPKSRICKKMRKSWLYVSKKLERNKENYLSFYKRQYRIEIFQHAVSTFKFLLFNEGLKKTFKLIFKRFEEVKRVKSWVSSDRADKRYDDDAIKENRKKFSQKDLFNID